MSRGFFRKGQALWGKTVAQLVGANAQLNLPTYSEITRIYLCNRTTNAVTGGIRIGTSPGGTQVVTAQAVAGTADLPISVAPSVNAILATVQILYVEAVTAWNNALVDVVVEYRRLYPLDPPTGSSVGVSNS